MPLNISIPQLQLEAKKEVHDARRNGTFRFRTVAVAAISDAKLWIVVL
jgi:hypothetical protein